MGEELGEVGADGGVEGEGAVGVLLEDGKDGEELGDAGDAVLGFEGG